MKKVTATSTAIASMYLALVSGQACAWELWGPRSAGSSEGQMPGTLPPPGMYAVLNSDFMSLEQYDSKGNRTGVKLDTQIEIPVFLWQTGAKVLGADYAMALSLPFDYTNVKVPNDAKLSNNAHWGTFNTVLVPGILAWSLPHDFHVKTALYIEANDPSSSKATPPANGGVGAGNSFWTVMPEFGVSWLHDGWNLSMDAYYAYNFEDRATDYKSGQEVSIDYTATKTIGKWTLGLGAGQINQVTNDSGAGAVAAGCASKDGCKGMNWGAGPIVGYQFGGVDVMAVYNRSIETRNASGGNSLNLRISIPIGL